MMFKTNLRNKRTTITFFVHFFDQLNLSYVYPDHIFDFILSYLKTQTYENKI